MDRVSIISLIVGGVLPLLTTSVTKASWPEWIKQVLLAALSAATGVGIDLEHTGGGASAAVIGANALTTFATAVAVSVGTWRPVGVLGRLESMFVRDTAQPPAAPNVTSIADKIAANGDTSPTSPTPNSN